LFVLLHELGITIQGSKNSHFASDDQGRIPIKGVSAFD